MRTALVHDWIPTMGGAEKVLESLYLSFPSPIYTLIKNESAIKNTIFEHATINTSFIQNLPFSPKKYRSYLPLFPLAIEQFNLSEFDVIISSSYAVAKGALSHSNQLHICYCHSPVRYAWDLYYQYLNDANLNSGMKGLLAKIVLHYLRNWDVVSTPRVDHFIANSKYIARRIKKVYNRDSTVIYPPVDTDQFEVCTAKEDYYVTASRMVPYKKIDLIVDAFSKMPDKKLIVIGDGPDFAKVKAKASKNVEILGFQSNSVLKHHMQRAKAFVFAAEEDFGITPVEAQACGTPVIAFGKGGALETVIDNTTGVFFDSPDQKSIISAVKKFEQIEANFDPNLIRMNAEKFSKPYFKSQIEDFVQTKYEAFCKQ
jgi:glycosyltransferase involved in cell wall biosynthesis